MSYQQGYREAASSPRPPSQLSTSTTGERERERERQHREREREQRERERVDNRQEYLQAYQEPAPRPQPPPSRNSVVIKVGMVGDAQIGKTSLMVKYVEGSWDEDYIQTLGMSYHREWEKERKRKERLRSPPLTRLNQVSISWRKPSQFEIQKSHSQFGI